MEKSKINEGLESLEKEIDRCKDFDDYNVCMLIRNNLMLNADSMDNEQQKKMIILQDKLLNLQDQIRENEQLPFL